MNPAQREDTSSVDYIAEEVLRRIGSRLNHFGGGGYVNVADADSVFYTRGGRSRSIAAIVGDVVNVKDPPYNAVGDGVTDDTSAIQAALNVGGRVVRLPAGSYAIGATSLTIPTNVSLVGDGMENTTIIYTGTGSAIQTTNTKWVQLRDFTLDGAGTSGTSVRGINMNGCWNFRISNVRIEGITPTLGASIRVGMGNSNWGSFNWIIDGIDSPDGQLVLVGNDGSNQITTGTIIGTWFKQYSHTWGSSIVYVNAIAENFTGVGFDFVSYDQITMICCDIEGSGATGIAFGTSGTRNFFGSGLNYSGFTGTNRFTGEPVTGMLLASNEAAQRYWGPMYQFTGTTASLTTGASETIISNTVAHGTYQIVAQEDGGNTAWRLVAFVFSDSATLAIANTVSNNITCIASGANIQLRNDGAQAALRWRAVRLK